MKKIIKKISIFVILLYIIAGISYAKYKQGLTGNGEVSVAKPILILDSTNDVKIDGMKDEKYKFSVKNYTQTQVNEVNLKYFIQIINHSDADLEFTLYKDGEIVDLIENQTEGILLCNLTKQEDEYELKIKYNNDICIKSDIYGSVQIKVEAIQENEQGGDSRWKTEFENL